VVLLVPEIRLKTRIRTSSFPHGPQSCAVLEAKMDFGGREIIGKIGAGDSGVMDGSALEIHFAQVGAAEIGIAQIGVAEDDFAQVHAAKIDAPQIGSGEIDRFPALGDPAEGVQFARPQALISFVIEKSRLVHGRFLS
jgi:hypothetical protein